MKCSSLLSFAVLAFTPCLAWGHGVPALVTLTPDLERLAILGSVPLGQLNQIGQPIFGREPGFGVSSPTAGPPSGTDLWLETTGGLLYWDGQQVAPTEAVLGVTAPSTDSHGAANPGAGGFYNVDAESGPQSGLQWSVYLGASNWDAHGIYTLTPGSAPGVYGFGARLTSSNLGASDEFLVAMVFDPQDVWDLSDEAAALEALADELSSSEVGDYDGDGQVTVDDYQRWRDEFGRSDELVTADGNQDGVVDAADFTLWRDAYMPTAAAPLSAPEPVACVVAMILFLLVNTTDAMRLSHLR